MIQVYCKTENKLKVLHPPKALIFIFIIKKKKKSPGKFSADSAQRPRHKNALSVRLGNTFGLPTNQNQEEVRLMIATLSTIAEEK